MEHRLRLALSRIWVAARRFGFFTLRCMVRRLGIAPSEVSRELYRLARLFNGIPPQTNKWLQEVESRHRKQAYETRRDTHPSCNGTGAIVRIAPK
jgi:hypothetical protein